MMGMISGVGGGSKAGSGSGSNAGAAAGALTMSDSGAATAVTTRYTIPVMMHPHIVAWSNPSSGKICGAIREGRREGGMM
jgi:hypothetical protein